ncbi:MAG: hypothetical protein JO197_01190 [Acidobacteria bacterium]|nr:hypothetical protein [Acidobacteriota bacterium]MBV9476269.1 hypothetical protein [Acidobacteriota bacterium]
MRRWIGGWIAAVLLLFAFGVPWLRAQSNAARVTTTQTEETVDATGTDGVQTTSTTTTTTSVIEGGIPSTSAAPPPAWTHLVRIAANAGPIAFLLLAWLIGGIIHVRMVRREQAQFPVLRGSRAPQTVPMIVSALLFLVPAILFIVFEVRSRYEIRRGLAGVVDEWQPVTVHAWTALVICLALALIPWLLARRADTVA